MAKYINNILECLEASKFKSLSTHLTKVELARRQVLYDVGEPIQYVYFMENAVASVLTTMSNGSTVEVGMIGYEGMAGFQAALGENVTNISSQHVVMQIPGTAYRMSAALCKDIFETNAVMRRCVLKFVDAFINQCSQTAACNRLHMVDQRIARWLLLSSNRTQTNSLPLTQEYLASMIGARRSGVSEAASELQRAGLITYTQGNITITDRAGLEKSACECYNVDRERFDKLLGK